MTSPHIPPLGPPPRKAHFRRAVRNMRRGYNLLFLLLIFVLIGWAALDAYRWPELSLDRRVLALGFGLGALLAFAIWRLVERPLLRELRLARRGAVAAGKITAIGQSRGRRLATIIAYTFQTARGETIKAECKLPRRVRPESVTQDMDIEVLYDPKRPRINRPTLALEFVEIDGGS